MEKIFNSYMDDAVMLWNEEFKAEAINEWDLVGGQDGLCGLYPIFLIKHITQEWLEMVRDN